MGRILKTYAGWEVDKAGGKWKLEYDNCGNLIKRTNPLKVEILYEYEDGLLKSIINTKGNKSLLEYDPANNLKRTIFLNGYEMEWHYDVLGNCIRSSDSAGNTRKIEFNLCSLPETIYEPDGNVRNLKFDADYNVVQAKDKHYDIRFGYGPLNNLMSRSQASHSISYKYDTEGVLTQLTNEHGETYFFEIDATDQVIKETGFDGLTRLYKRNAAGKVERMERPGNKFTRYAYNENGIIVEVGYHDESVERYTYDKRGLLTAASNANSNITFERDILGRVIKETCDKEFVSYEYDVLGNRTRINSSMGADIENEFDELGNTIATRAGDWESRQQYNEQGLEIERILPGNIICQWIRDKLGRPSRQSLARSGSVLHNRQYTWDVNYRLQLIADSDTGITQFMHDEIGNLAKTIFSDGTEQWRNPDATGNLFNSPDRKDRDYGKGGKLLRSTGTRFQYDDEGNMVEKKEPSGRTWKYQWHANGMLESVIRPDGDVVNFKYDALGRRLSKIFNATIIKWLWNGDKPLHEWKEKIFPENKLKYLEPKNQSVLTWIFNEDNFIPVAKISGNNSISIVSDHIGTPFQMYSDKGELIWESQIDSFGNSKILIGDKGSCPFRNQGQYEDIETGLYYNRFRYYDPNSNFYISQDPLRTVAGIKLYSYVPDINLYTDIFGLAKRKDVDLGSGYKGGIDTFNTSGSASFEIHVYKSGKEVGVIGPSGWIWKHGFTSAPTLPPDIQNKLDEHVRNMRAKCGIK
ncbi:MAG: RHS repeat protein [Chitinophagaceae bacterium]|nr:RHS repeat protein [Chitinophagaceae bacterium]